MNLKVVIETHLGKLPEAVRSLYLRKACERFNLGSEEEIPGKQVKSVGQFIAYLLAFHKQAA